MVGLSLDIGVEWRYYPHFVGERAGCSPPSPHGPFGVAALVTPSGLFFALQGLWLGRQPPDLGTLAHYTPGGRP